MIIGDKVITYRILNNEKGKAFITKLLNKYDVISIDTEEEEKITVIKIGFLVDSEDDV